MDFLTEIDKNALAFYSQNPELLVSTGPWETIAICDLCLQEVDIDDGCLSGWVHTGLIRTCPTCGKHGGWVYEHEPSRRETAIYHTYPLPHKKFRKRRHVTSIEPRLFRPDIVRGFWEFEEIPFLHPLETKESHMAKEAKEKQTKKDLKNNQLSKIP